MHILPADLAVGDVRGWSRNELSQSARDVLRHGNTSVNYLVWRRSMLRVCLFVLSFSLVAQWKAMQIWPFQSANKIEIMVAKEGHQQDTSVFDIAAGYVRDVCNGLCSLQSAMDTVQLDMTGNKQCGMICTTATNFIQGLGDSTLQCAANVVAVDDDSAAATAGADSENSVHRSMADKLDWHQDITHGAKFLASVFAMRQ